MATHSIVLAWRIPWTEEPDSLQSMGSQRVGHDIVTDNSNNMLRTQTCTPIISLPPTPPSSPSRTIFTTVIPTAISFSSSFSSFPSSTSSPAPPAPSLSLLLFYYFHIIIFIPISTFTVWKFGSYMTIEIHERRRDNQHSIGKQLYSN